MSSAIQMKCLSICRLNNKLLVFANQNRAYDKTYSCYSGSNKKHNISQNVSERTAIRRLQLSIEFTY